VPENYTKGENSMKWLMLIPMMMFLVACEKQGPLERAGEEVDEAIQDIKAGGETTGNKIDDAIDEARKDLEDVVEEDPSE
jgi:predicted small lipoprotein YifL